MSRARVVSFFRHRIIRSFRTKLAAALLVGAAAGASLSSPAFAAMPDTRPPGSAPIPKAPIGLSNLVIRIEGRDQIGLASADYRIFLIERLRERGFVAVGAENLVFDKDESRSAAFRLGGIVRELDCLTSPAALSCRIGVEWQVLDVARDAVVYSALTKSVVFNVPTGETTRMATRLLLGAFDSLLVRNRFREVLAASPAAASAASPAFPSATFARCAPMGQSMPGASEDVLQAAVVVRGRAGFGSGFFVTADGLVITAAHVVDAPNLTLRLRDGTEINAIPVRMARGADVALLRPERPLGPHRYLAPSDKAAPPIGAEVYAVGAPGHMDLAFSLTRGIVSGMRDLDGQRALQTDAPVSPGNSGGPLVDGSGAVIGVTSFKLTGKALEGLGFGVPIGTALTALSLSPGAATDATLLTAQAADLSVAPVNVLFTDAPDATPSFDPEGDRRRAALAERRARIDARDRATPTHVKALLWGGMTLAGAGVITTLATYAKYGPATTTQPEFDSLRIWNATGWAMMGVGVGSMISYLILRPALPDAPKAAPAPASAPSSTMSIGLHGVRWEGSF